MRWRLPQVLPAAVAAGPEEELADQFLPFLRPWSCRPPRRLGLVLAEVSTCEGVVPVGPPRWGEEEVLSFLALVPVLVPVGVAEHLAWVCRRLGWRFGRRICSLPELVEVDAGLRLLRVAGANCPVFPLPALVWIS